MADEEVKIKLPPKLRQRAAKALASVIEGDGELIKAVKEPQSEKGRRELLFLRATVAYLVDPLGRPPDAFFSLMEGTMSLQHFRSRAFGDKWTSQRERIRAQARQDLVRKLGRQVVSDQMREARRFQKLQGWMYDLCSPAMGSDGDIERNEKGMPLFHISPKSLEGAIKALKEITVLLNAYRREILGGIEPAAPEDIGVAGEHVGPYSEQEVGEMAEQLLEQRMLSRQASRDDDES